MVALTSWGASMPGWLIILLVFGAFFLWAGYKVSRSGPAADCQSRDARGQSTHGGDAIGGG